MLAATYLLAVTCAWAARAPGAEPRTAFIDRFEQHVAGSTDVDAKARELILQSIRERAEDSDDESLMVESLAMISPDFLEGLDAYDDEDYTRCVELMDQIVESPDPYIGLHAAVYAAKALVQAERLVEAQQRIGRILDDVDLLRQYTLEEPAMRYMLGYSQLQNLEYDQAKTTLERFLADFPDASPRFVMTAKQMLAEIARRIPKSIGEVADLMTFSEKRLAGGDATERVQEAQERIVALLDNIIDQTEQMEQQQQQQQQQKQNQPQQDQQQQQPDPSQPLPDSQLPSDQYRDGLKRPGRQVNPGEAWGNMPDAERAEVLQVIQESFPGRYRSLVEQYYRSLAEE